VTLPPLTPIFCPAGPEGAGPSATEPSDTLNLLPWQRQSIVPSETAVTGHPAWVQIVE
jgi:hypothetical protein